VDHVIDPDRILVKCFFLLAAYATGQSPERIRGHIDIIVPNDIPSVLAHPDIAEKVTRPKRCENLEGDDHVRQIDQIFVAIIPCDFGDERPMIGYMNALDARSLRCLHHHLFSSSACFP
jgi:hypothetical protein